MKRYFRLFVLRYFGINRSTKIILFKEMIVVLQELKSYPSGYCATFESIRRITRNKIDSFPEFLKDYLTGKEFKVFKTLIFQNGGDMNNTHWFKKGDIEIRIKILIEFIKYLKEQ